MSIPWPPVIAEWNEEEGDEERCVNDGRIAKGVAAGSRRSLQTVRNRLQAAGGERMKNRLDLTLQAKETIDVATVYSPAVARVTALRASLQSAPASHQSEPSDPDSNSDSNSTTYS
jgi:hypothetical protein